MSSSINNQGSGPGMKKFMFDSNDFNKRELPVEPPEVTFNEAQLNEARTQSHAQGKADGIRETRQNQEEMIIAALQRIGKQAEQMIASEERREVEMMTNAARLALRVVQKLMPQFSNRFAVGEIERVVLSAIDARKDEPRVNVSVNSQHLAALQGRIDDLAAEKGFAGRLVVTGDDHIAPGDCRLEWADGGAQRIFDRLYAQIEEEFTKAIDGMEKSNLPADDQHS